ncbi:MAG: transcription termination factor Rho, partial [Opitutales bacterium]
KSRSSSANEEQTRDEADKKKGNDPKEAASAAEERETKDEKDSSQVFFSTDGSEPQEDKGPPSEDDKPTGVKSPPPDTGQGGQHRHGQKKQRQQHWQNKKRGGGKHQHLKQKQKPKRRRRKTPSDLEERYPLEIGNLHECEQFANVDAIEAFAKECPAGDGDAIDFNSLYVLDLVELKEKISELEPDLELPLAPVREEMFDLLFHKRFEDKLPVMTEGVLEVMEEGYGLLLQVKDNYRIKSQSAFVPQVTVKRYGLQTGHVVEGFLRPKMEQATCPVLARVERVMGNPPEDASKTIPFTELIPYYPLERIFLETNSDVEWDNVSMRVVDLVSPIGFGQRGLIVAPPRTGKTVLQQCMARALRTNNPDAHLIILLADERPEEVTDFRRQVPDSEVIASTFDENAESHVHAAEIVIEKARRMVEIGRDVVILLDSITRLARAYNTTMPNSGKILSGGVEATALQRPKRFFGSARNIEGGGSLTILGTALVETGSKMDEVIFEEFKGTGNMELHLDRELVNKRIFPALDFEKSGTRKEELLYHQDE